MSMVKVRGLGKLYHHHLPRYRTLVGRLRCALDGRKASLPVWALKDVSFDVGRGECLGIAGPNGSGKSTLLSVISGIIEPTEGNVSVEGKANTFFNLGAGLQTELGVRDNIEICGILMGLRRRQVRERMDAILEFSGIGDLADVRMAELSTGQAARVSFSTMVHSDLDLMLIDEALAVGDAAFQEKCLGEFSRLRRDGKTLIVVSHDEDLLGRLGAKILRMKGGRVESIS